MRQIFANLASAEVASPVAPTDTVVVVTDASRLPAPADGEFWAGVLYQVSGGAESGHEVVHVTRVTGTALTVIRAAEPLADGTQAPMSFASGDRIELRNTAGTMASISPDAILTDGESILIGPGGSVLTK